MEDPSLVLLERVDGLHEPKQPELEPPFKPKAQLRIGEGQ